MCLTARLALYLLNGFKEDGGRLLFEDGTDVPLDAYGLAHQQSDARSSEA
jgi:hypothetical protein